MKKYIYLLMIIVLWHNKGYAQTDNTTPLPLTFSDALKKSLSNNFKIKEKEDYQKSKQMERKSFQGLYFPQISMDASWMNMSKDLTIDMNPLKESILPLYSTLENYGSFKGVPNPDPRTNTIMPILPDDISTQAVRSKLSEGRKFIENTNWEEVMQKKQFGTVNLSMMYPIYAGGKIRAANRAANIEYQEASNELEEKKSEITLELIERYFGLIMTNHAYEVRKEVLNNLTLHLNNAKLLKEQGLISEAEYLHAKVYYSEAERNFKKTERELTIINKALQNTLAGNEEQQIIPLSELFVFQNIPPLSYFTSMINDNNYQLKKVTLKKDLWNIKHQMEKENLLPNIALTGSYNIYNKDLSPLVPDYFVGVGIHWVLFDGGKRIRDIQASNIQKSQLNNIQNRVESDLNTVVTKYYQEMNMYYDELNELKTSIQFAEEYYRIRTKAFNEGMATTAEVSDASLALAKAKIDQWQASYNFDLALARLLFFCGKINEFENYSSLK